MPLSDLLLGRDQNRGFKPSDVNMDRIGSELEQLSHVGRQDTNGITRTAFSEEHKAVTRMVAGWMREAGLNVYFDKWGNMFGRATDLSGPVVLTGSHLDSVPNGGNYDGPLGVLSSLEALRMILASGKQLTKPIAIVSFVEEEGASFRGLLGSALAVGQINDNEIDNFRHKQTQMSLRDALSQFHFESYHVDYDHSLMGNIDSFLELHIEQGTRLEAGHTDIGIVTNIAGPIALKITLQGQPDHAGTTEYNVRRDSLLAASEIILGIRDLAVTDFSDSGRMTVGKIEADPNVANIIAGKTTLVVDIRGEDESIGHLMRESVEALVQEICKPRNITWTSDIDFAIPAAPISDRVYRAFSHGCAAAKVSHVDLVSWAAHDTMNMSKVTNSGMIFVPCKDGRSHCPEEFTAPDDIRNGIAVMANAILQLASE